MRVSDYAEKENEFMAQLKMYRFMNIPFECPPLPEGYSFSNFKDDSDRLAWVECCKNGLVADDAGEQEFYNAIESRPCVDLYKDVYFLDYKGEHIGTVTCNTDEDGRAGEMHMVGMKTEFRGKGLSKYLTKICLDGFAAHGVEYVHLTTDEWRKGAVKSYLTAGFLPVNYDEGMEERWALVLKEYGIPEVRMLNDDTTPFRILRAAE